MASRQVDRHQAPLPTVANVDRIAGLGDPVVRNLQITQCYHELSLALAAATGGNANWCTFATWASKQVGQTIRREDLTRTFERFLQASPVVSETVGAVVRTLPRIGPLPDPQEAWRIVGEAVALTASFDRASVATMRGNLKVFDEIAREFARFLTLFAGEPTFDAQRIAAFCDALRPGEPPDGQRYLRQAFTRYYQARFTPDAKQRAELMLLANLEIGLHEQTRLQPEIAEALDAPVIRPDELERRLIALLFPRLAWVPRVRPSCGTLLGWRSPLQMACALLADQAEAIGRLAITEHLMTLGLPTGEPLRLGQDLRAEFPASLMRLVNAELLALLGQIDPTPDSRVATGAEDWSDLLDRMHFITDLFRCFQERPDLHSAPFSPDQVSDIKSGRRPAGRL